MHRTTLNRWTLLILVAMFLPQPSEAQPCQPPVTRAWLEISNVGLDKDSLWFGFDSTATCGEDPHLCEIALAEPCGAPTNMFCIWWTDWCYRQNAFIGADYRAYVNPAKIDTHRVGFSPGPSGYPMHLRWSPGLVRGICDSARLQDEFGGFFYNIRMHVIDSLQVSAYPPISNLLLIRYGQKLDLMSVHDKSSELPARVMLDQNYPNPFNPVTKIRYQLPRQGHVTLKMYDLLGREVATLVDGELLAGEHEVTFDGRGLATGVYFYRLQAGKFVETKRLVLLN